MATWTLVGIAAAVVVAGVVIIRFITALKAYFAFRGERLITCPETHHTEAVDVAARKAALTALFGEPNLRLDRCSRWPERSDCGQECLKQVESDPKNCLVWNIVSHWYLGKRCVFCQKRFDELHHVDHAPALLGPDGMTAEWKQFEAKQLPEVLFSYQPVCWDCHVAETFRRTKPELVVDRHRDAQVSR